MMIPRLMTTCLSIWAILWLSINIAAADNSVDGKIEKASNGVVELKDDSGTISKYDVDSGAKITLDGKSVKLDELPVGAPATVTTEIKNNKTVAVKITAKSPL